MSKIRLYIRSRKQGSYIASVPIIRLTELSNRDKKRWEFKPDENGGWLTLEAM